MAPVFLTLCMAGGLPRAHVARPVAVDVAAGPTSSCDLPVAAALSDGFRPPDAPWLPGNRGLTYATVAGQPVRAVAGGTVSFAGRIASQTYVTVDLGSGRDTTYSFLATTPLVVGDVIGVGDPIGITGPVAFQLGYREGPNYLDPGELLIGLCRPTHAVLVPVPGGSH